MSQLRFAMLDLNGSGPWEAHGCTPVASFMTPATLGAVGMSLQLMTRQDREGRVAGVAGLPGAGKGPARSVFAMPFCCESIARIRGTASWTRSGPS